MSQDKSFVKGTIILASSSMAVKVLSAVYRIPITRIMGAEAMGAYTAAFNLFMPFYAFATAGITPTISRFSTQLSTQGYGAIPSLRKKASHSFGAFSMLMIALALLVSGIYAKIINTPFMFLGVAILCPNLFFATYEAIYKGISQGTLDMGVTAKANLLESTSKVVLGISSVYLAGVLVQKNTTVIQQICALCTISISGFICWAYMSQDFVKSYKNRSQTPTNVQTKALFDMAFPISLSALIVSATNFFDTVVGLSLVKHIPEASLIRQYGSLALPQMDSMAIWLFGIYHGLSLTIINLIPSISAAIGTSSLPVITRSKIAQNKQALERQVHKLMRFTSVCVIPMSLYVFFFADEVIITLFGDKGAQTVIGALFLRLLAPTAIFSAFSFPLNSVLHAHEKSAVIFKILLACGTVKAVLTLGLCSIPSINLKGCIFSSIVFYVLNFFLSVLQVKKTGVHLTLLKELFIPFALSYVLLTFTKFFVNYTLGNIPVFFKTIFSGGFFVVLYALFIIFTGFLVDIPSEKVVK